MKRLLLSGSVCLAGVWMLPASKVMAPGGTALLFR